MQYTPEDIANARKLLAISKDDLIYHLPADMPNEVVSRLCDLGWFDNALGLPIMVLCSDETLELAEKQMREKRAHDDNQKRAAIAKERADKKEAFRHDCKVAAFSAIFTHIIDHIDVLYSSIIKGFGLFSEWVATFHD